jgi:hypothetical protein
MKSRFRCGGIRLSGAFWEQYRSPAMPPLEPSPRDLPQRDRHLLRYIRSLSRRALDLARRHDHGLGQGAVLATPDGLRYLHRSQLHQLHNPPLESALAEALTSPDAERQQTVLCLLAPNVDYRILCLEAEAG